MDKPTVPSVDEIKGKWKQHVGAAKLAWGKLTEDELLKAEGRQDKLAGAIEERYAITRDEADRQVKRFFETLNPRKK
ncbi:MAG: CsbD family protein [Pseudomonadales bacterium]